MPVAAPPDAAIRPDELTAALPAPEALIPIPPFATEMFPDELTWTIFPSASMPSPAPPIEIAPDELTTTSFTPLAMIPVPSFATEMAPDEATRAVFPSASIASPLPPTNMVPDELTVAAPPSEKAPIAAPSPPIETLPDEVTVAGPLAEMALIALPSPPMAMLPDELAVAPVTPIALIPRPLPPTSIFPDELTVVAAPAETATIAAPLPWIEMPPDDATLTAPDPPDAAAIPAPSPAIEMPPDEVTLTAPSPPDTAVIPAPPKLPAMEIPPEELTATAPRPKARMALPPLVREMLPDDATLTSSVSLEEALIPIALFPARDRAPEEITVTPPTPFLPPMSKASIASPSPLTDMLPDELTVTWFPADALIPAPAPVTDMAPEEFTSTVPSLVATMPFPPFASEMLLADAMSIAPARKESALMPLEATPLTAMSPELVSLIPPSVAATMPSTKSPDVIIRNGPVALLSVMSPAPKNRIPGCPLALVGAILLVNALTLRTVVPRERRAGIFDAGRLVARAGDGPDAGARIGGGQNGGRRGGAQRSGRHDDPDARSPRIAGPRSAPDPVPKRGEPGRLVFGLA